jgi:hypothetical protein
MAWRVVLPYAVFCVDTEGDMVVLAAPIATWMVGKSRSYVRAWVEGKHGTIEYLGSCF